MTLLAVAVALVIAGVVLVWPGQGTGFVWTTAPGGPLAYRVRRGALLPRLLGSDGVALFGVLHFRGRPSAYLYAHEVAHVMQAREAGGWLQFLSRYLTSSAYRAQQEAAAVSFGTAYAAHPTLAQHRRWLGYGP